jgi:hypothetical protein
VQARQLSIALAPTRRYANQVTTGRKSVDEVLAVEQYPLLRREARSDEGVIGDDLRHARPAQPASAVDRIAAETHNLVGYRWEPSPNFGIASSESIDR